MSATVFFESASEIATLRNVFELNGVPTDPTTIALTVTTPAQVSTTYTFALAEITKNSTGDYQKDITCSQDGDWSYTWEGAGAVQDVTHGSWHVFPTDIGKLYAPIDALKSRLGITTPSTDTVDDLEFHSACFAASRSIEQYCERVFYRSAAATVRTFEPHDYYCLRLPEFNDLVSVTTLKTDSAGDGTYETTWTTSDYQLLPYNPAAAPEQLPYTSIKAIGSLTFPYPVYGASRSNRVEITGVFGWPSVPYAIKQATLILAAETFKMKDAPLGVAGFGEFGVVRIQANPKVAAFANPYRRNAMLVA